MDKIEIWNYIPTSRKFFQLQAAALYTKMFSKPIFFYEENCQRIIHDENFSYIVTCPRNLIVPPNSCNDYSLNLGLILLFGQFVKLQLVGDYAEYNSDDIAISSRTLKSCENIELYVDNRHSYEIVIPKNARFAKVTIYKGQP